MQGDETITACIIVQRIIISACAIEPLLVETIWIVFTNGLIHRFAAGELNAQMQRNKAIATIVIDECIEISACRGESMTIEMVSHIAACAGVDSFVADGFHA